MPELGEIKRGRDIGYKGRDSYIWTACVDCGKERWSQKRHSRPTVLICRSCNAKKKYMVGLRNYSGPGEASGGWKGGRYKTDEGYILIWISHDDFSIRWLRKGVMSLNTAW